MRSTTGRTPLVGREREMGLLRDALHAARDGHGRVVLVLGEAGIGKSRLLDTLAHDADAVVLWGRAVQGGGAYRPVADALVGALRAGADLAPESLGAYGAALGRLLPDWADAAVAAPEAGVDPGLVLGEAVARFTAAVGRGRPCLLLLEDLHWADADSWAVLEHLAGAVLDLPVLVVGTTRDEPGPARRDEVLTLRLGRLAPPDVRRLAEALGVNDPARVAALEQRADGLPHLVEELAALDSTTAVPPTVRTVVRERLDSLAETQRRVVAGAAVLGLDPDWSLLPAVVAMPEETVLQALRAAEAAGLLAAEGGVLRWRSSITRDAVLASVLAPEAAALARRSAEALLARGRPEDDTSAVQLLRAAGGGDQVGDLLLTVARRDLARGAFRTAGQLLAELDADPSHRVAAAVERVRLLCLQGQPRRALETLLPVLDEAVGDDHAELALALARAAVAAGRWDTCRALVQRAGRPDDARSATLLADAAHGAGLLDEARRHAVEAVGRAEHGADPELLCDALAVLARVERLTDGPAARVLFERAAQVAAEHGLVRSRVEAVIGEASIDILEHEDPARLEVARRLALGAGLVGALAAVDLLRTDAVLVTDGPAAALPLADDLARSGRLLGLPMPGIAAAAVRAMAAAAEGDRAGTRDALTAAGAPGGPAEAAVVPAGAEALLALAAHDLRTANAALDPAVSAAVGHLSAAPLHHFGVWALLRTACDDRGAAARETLASVPAGARRANRTALAYAEAVAAGRAGSHEAADLLARAEELGAATPWLRRVLRSVALDSAVVDGWGEPVPLLRASLAEHEERGEEAWARVVRDLLRRAGAPTRRGRGDSAVPPALAALGITRREADVLALVVTGATNAEIAERLFLSRRTVETHVAHLLQKTSAASRAELRDRVSGVDR